MSARNGAALSVRAIEASTLPELTYDKNTFVKKTIGICQSNYIPWKGYFDLIRASDVFILYDTVQYTKNDWRNRNRIRTPEGVLWLTIPVETSGKFGQLIKDTKVQSGSWYRDHWKTISQNYHRAPYFKMYKDILEQIYEEAGKLKFLSEINRLFLTHLNRLLGIDTSLRTSMEFELPPGRLEKLVFIINQLNGTEYLSGPTAKAYLEVDLFQSAGINVRWANYDGYPEYKQCFDGFEPQVSIVDLLLNTGPDAKSFLKDF